MSPTRWPASPARVRGYLPKVTSFLVTGAAVAAAGLGVAALRDAE